MFIERVLSGCFFWLIIITNLASERFGYLTFNDLDAEAKLQKISESPRRFKIGFVLILTEHFSIVALAVFLFLAFSPHNLTLALIWMVSRTAEGLVQIYFKKDYWRLLETAGLYPGSGGVEKNELIDTARMILNTKGTVFSYTQILFSIGTLAYSTLFIVHGVIPAAIGWFGIAAATLYGSGNMIFLLKSGSKALWNIGGLLILLFELVLGGWLIFTG